MKGADDDDEIYFALVEEVGRRARALLVELRSGDGDQGNGGEEDVDGALSSACEGASDDDASYGGTAGVARAVWRRYRALRRHLRRVFEFVAVTDMDVASATLDDDEAPLDIEATAKYVKSNLITLLRSEMEPQATAYDGDGEGGQSRPNGQLLVNALGGMLRQLRRMSPRKALSRADSNDALAGQSPSARDDDDRKPLSCAPRSDTLHAPPLSSDSNLTLHGDAIVSVGAVNADDDDDDEESAEGPATAVFAHDDYHKESAIASAVAKNEAAKILHDRVAAAAAANSELAAQNSHLSSEVERLRKELQELRAAQMTEAMSKSSAAREMQSPARSELDAVVRSTSVEMGDVDEAIKMLKLDVLARGTRLQRSTVMFMEQETRRGMQCAQESKTGIESLRERCKLQWELELKRIVSEQEELSNLESACEKAHERAKSAADGASDLAQIFDKLGSKRVPVNAVPWRRSGNGAEGKYGDGGDNAEDGSLRSQLVSELETSVVADDVVHARRARIAELWLRMRQYAYTVPLEDHAEAGQHLLYVSEIEAFRESRGGSFSGDGEGGGDNNSNSNSNSNSNGADAARPKSRRASVAPMQLRTTGTSGKSGIEELEERRRQARDAFFSSISVRSNGTVGNESSYGDGGGAGWRKPSFV